MRARGKKNQKFRALGITDLLKSGSPSKDAVRISNPGEQAVMWWACPPSMVGVGFKTGLPNVHNAHPLAHHCLAP